ncbi:hypothetical protein LPJ78_000263 [Coemansia sp. RSA 989]|nr:U3-containing 90S pre-ribosomal complex subunit-domain containing protein [Coemansia mojavensis]KAJ1738850.1 hypothetical protein LPJ68_005191 [Coemansia sp. RSA 1086]KAJ1752708.1 hypothetical protein LPJ79_000964 [Coemansia sp. RSA 1821]KAJ1868325.1 hypothetical protein LPJ78_000263 [Coemansia sp. RSA 989]KAJ1875562.1 hypothetical protein LPJ55_000555 [Coemansia sp. RSA 990]KAJ2673154.1 hypothetical protein IWW42_002439 [Coemansia sp. RSA 1085]
MGLKADAADDLQDEFDLDDSLVAPSDHEDSIEQPGPAHSTKRKSSTDAKPKKRKKTIKTHTFTVPQQDTEQCALWNKFMHKTYPALTQLELADIGLLPKHIYSITNAHDSSLGSIVQSALSTGKAKNKVMLGAPQVLVLCSSALRVLELVKMFRPLCKRNVMKLFSRHIKISQQREMLKQTAVDIAVGTPNRVRKLLEEQSVKVNRLRLVVVDCWQDDKMRVVVDMDDTRDDLFGIWRDTLLPASKNPDYMFKLRLV